MREKTMIEKIQNHVIKLQKLYPAHHVKFVLFDDCTGSFGYLGQDGHEEIETFDSPRELYALVAED